jgi:hypothetical protein
MVLSRAPGATGAFAFGIQSILSFPKNRAARLRSRQSHPTPPFLELLFSAFALVGRAPFNRSLTPKEKEPTET